MTREELRKKRQEIAKNNGYTDYKGKSQNQPVNQQPVEPKVSTWDKVMNIAKSMGTDVGNIGKNFGLGVTSAVKSSGYYIQDMTENKFGDYKRYNQQQSALMKKAEETEKLTKDKGTVNINDVKLPENPNQRQMVSEEETKKALLPQKQESRVLKSIDESIAKDEEKIQQNIDNSSNRVSKKLAELMPSIAQSVTGMGASVVNPALGLGFWQTSAGGGYTREAEKNGYTGNDAMLYGTIMGSMESATEWIGAKLTAGVGKAFFKKGAVEGLKAFGLDVGENFLEEAVMEPIQETVKQAIGKDGDWQNIGSRMLQSGINGALTSIIMGGASAGIGSATNLITKAQSGQEITQKEIADTLKEINKSEEVDIEKILANNFNFTAEDLAVNIDARQRTEQRLENVAEGMSRNEAQQLLINESDLDDTQKEVLSEITNQYNLSDEDVKRAIQNTKDGKYNNLQDTTTQNNEVLNQEQQTIQDENKMAQNETSQQQRDLIQDLQKFNETRQEGQEIFDLDNEENVKEVQAIQKVAEKRGINITFDENRFNNADTNAFYEYDKDGNVANIVLNPNSTSKKYVQNLVIHEMTHSFEGSKQYDSLSKAILDYAKSKGEYDTAFRDLMDTYSKVYSGENLNKIVEKEAVANILGEKLGDKEFVDSLVNNQYIERSTIQKIIDFVKNQINRFKGYKDQEAYWNHVKTLFEDAYNKSEVSKEGLKQSIETNNKISNENPTTNPDIRYSQDTTGAWNNFIEKYFKNEGEGTAIKDLKKLPTREYTIQDYEEVINNSANIPEADKKSILKDLEGIELNKQSLNDFKQYVNDLDKNYSKYSEGQFSVETENQEIEQPTQEVELPKPKKVLNPTEISNLTPEDASTTPELPNKKYKEGTKVSNFVSNIENDVGFLNNEEKQELLKDDNVKFYAEVTNADTLAKAYDNLKENGKNATIEWYAKPTENATAEDVATGWILLKQYSDKGDTQGMVNVAKKLRDMGTKAGQTVQAFNILSRLTPEGMVAYTQGELQDAYNEMIKGKSKKWIDQHKSDFDLSQDEVAYIMDTMQNLPEENPANNNYDRKVALGQIQKLFTDKIPSENNKIKAWMRISMLFNPKTQVRNVAGNAIVVPVNMTSDFLGSKVDKLLSKYTGVRTLGNANVKAYLEGMKEGFYESYNDFRLGINTRDIQQNKFEFGQGKAFKDKGIGKALNRVDNLLNFVMDFGDRGFSQASFVNSLNNQLLLNGVTTPTQEMIDIATEESLSRTWNDDNEYTKFVLGVRRALNKVGTKNYGLGDVLIPFAKTPANLTKAIVEYSPVGLTKSLLDIPNIKNAIETGQMTAQQQHQFADHLGKGMAGTLLYIAGYALAKAGIATGEPEEDKDVKNFMKNSLGIGSYSIKIGDKSFAYDWAQPVATPLAIMTNLYQTNKNNPDASLLDKTLSAVNIGTNQLLEQSFMESLNEVLNGNGEITDRIQKAILDLPARAIPTFSKQIADMVDGTQRTSFEYGQPVQSAINSAKAKLPFVSRSLTPVIDTLGNEVQKYGGENNWFNVFFNPANMNKGEKTKAGEEIYKVYEETGDTTIFPVTAPYYVNYDGSKITMDSKQRAEYQKTAGDYTEQAVNDLINDKDYQKLDDSEKAEILSKVVTDSNEKAKRDVLNIDKNSSDLDLIDQVGSDYYTYKLSEKGKTKQPEKCEVLLNKDYSNKNKQLIYSNEINKDDKTYNGLLQINKNLNMNDYLGFKAQTFEGENKKQDMTNYLQNSNLSREEQLYILGKNYKLNASQRQELESLLRNKMPSNDIINVLQSIK